MVRKIYRAGLLTLIFICVHAGFAGVAKNLTPQKSTVGCYRDINNNLSSLSYISTNGGAIWSLSNALPLPGDVAANGSQNSELQGVTCNSTNTFCKAVGFYRNMFNNFVPLSYTTVNGGASWSLSSRLPLPIDVAANGIQNSKIQSAACDSLGNRCNTVGFYLDNGNNIIPLSYTSATGGAVWSLSTRLPLPIDVAANGIQNNKLQSVACNSLGSLCNAVGFYSDIFNNLAPLSYTSTNGGATWSLSSRLPLPLDRAANGIQNSKLQSVTCDSTGYRCSTVGFYLNNGNNLAPLSYTTVNGGATWSLSAPLPLPSNVAAMGIQNSELLSVACNSSGSICSAVGFYLDTLNNFLPLSYTSANGGVTWSLSARPPLPLNVAANGIQNNRLQSVDCDSTGSHCGAVGVYLDNGNNLAPLSYTSANSGVTWSLSASLPLPQDVAAMGSRSSVLFSVSGL